MSYRVVWVEHGIKTQLFFNDWAKAMKRARHQLQISPGLQWISVYERGYCDEFEIWHRKGRGYK